MLQNFLRDRRFWLLVALGAAAYLVVLMLTTTPQAVGPGGVVSWFGVAYVLIVAALISLQGYVLERQPKLRWSTMSRQALWGVGGIGLVALRSLGQLQLRDTVLIILLVAIAALYIRRTS